MQFNDLMLRRFMDDRMRELALDGRRARRQAMAHRAWRSQLARMLLAAARRLEPGIAPAPQRTIEI